MVQMSLDFRLWTVEGDPVLKQQASALEAPGRISTNIEPD